MSEPSLADVLGGDDSSTEAAAPVAGRTRQAIAAGGTASVEIEVGDSFEGIYNGFSIVTGTYGDSKSFKFTLIADASLVVVSKDKDTGTKSKERKTLEAGSKITAFMKGNGGWAMEQISEGQDVEVRRLEDGTLPKGHKFAGRPVATFEVLA